MRSPRFSDSTYGAWDSTLDRFSFPAPDKLKTVIRQPVRRKA